MSYKIFEHDPLLLQFEKDIELRMDNYAQKKLSLVGKEGSLSDFANGHDYFGFHKTDDGWVYREWAPAADEVYLTGDFVDWRWLDLRMTPLGNGVFEIFVKGRETLYNGCHVSAIIRRGEKLLQRIPLYIRRVEQDPVTFTWCGVIVDEPEYKWKKKSFTPKKDLYIYECHIGMAQEKEGLGTYLEFKDNILPRIKDLGYNTIQIMAIMEHPYYGSFGYQVANFYALSSRFGTPEEFKALVDEAHGLGIAVVMDIVHSHSVDNEAEGLGLFDGKETLYFYDGWQGHHPAWGSRCFDYGKDETKYFLLSNCKYWMEEYHIDGFRFDGVTSMLYWDHGLEKAFVGYESYFNQGVDDNAIAYLALANILIHEMNEDAFTIAEDVSGMAGLAAPLEQGGVGFDFRMSMGVADNWIKWIKELSDDQWGMGEMWWQLTNKRDDEKTISYAECHDQAMVGDKTIAFRLMDKEMYFSMNKDSQSDIVDRGIALHKMIRLVTMATCGNGYLTFMGNEFGHPEWIDFPREGNGWSYKHARRQWSLAEPDYLRYRYLRNFDKAMIHLAQSEGILDEKPELFVQDEQKKILIFKRKNCIFALNFNPTVSFADYAFAAPAGKYEAILDTDESEFDGFSRLNTGEEHFSVPERSENGNGKYKDSLSLYLPSRCAVVLKKID